MANEKLATAYKRYSNDQSTGNGGMKMMNNLEQTPFFKEKNCASICDYIPLFFSQRKISNGKPSDTCTNVLVDDWFKERGLDNGIMSFLGPVVLNVVSVLA